MKNEMTKVLCVGIFNICLVFFLALFSFPGDCAAEPIIIGSPQCMGHPCGINNARAITLAVEEINAKGGVDIGGAKRAFKLEVIDDRDLEPGVPVSEILLAVEKLILQKKADFLVGGPARSEGALAMMDLLNRYKKVAIVTIGTKSPRLEKRVAQHYNKYKYFFRMTSNAIVITKNLLGSIDGLELKKKYELNKAYIMAQDVAHTRALSNILSKGLSQRGWTVTGTKLYPTGATDFSMGLLDAREKGAQLLVLGFDMPEASILVKQWYDLKIPVLIHGLAAVLTGPEMWKATEGKIEYVLNDPLDTGNGANCEITEWMPRYWKAYTEKWGEEPGTETVNGYEGVYVLRDALERAGTLDAEAVIKALEQTDMMGVRGRIRFDPKSHFLNFSRDPKIGCTDTVIQWQDGKRVVLWPLEHATATIKFPPWMKVKE